MTCRGVGGHRRAKSDPHITTSNGVIANLLLALTLRVRSASLLVARDSARTNATADSSCNRVGMGSESS